MHAAVIELYALADAVRPAAQYHDFAFVARCRLAEALVGGGEVGGGAGEFGGAGIDALVHRMDGVARAQGADFRLAHAAAFGEEGVGEAGAFVGKEAVGVVQVGQSAVAQRLFEGDQFGDLCDKPRVNAAQAVHVVHAHALAQGFGDVKDALRRRGGDRVC